MGARIAATISQAVKLAATVTLVAVAALLVAAFGPTLLGARSMIVTSGSMEPTLPVGSVAITRPIDARAVGIGDIVTFRHRGARMPVTHRVLGIGEEGGARIFTTKGDANAAADPEPVVVSGPIDRVERVVPRAGTIVSFARSPGGGLLLIVVPILGLTADSARSKRRRQRAPEPEPMAPVVELPHCPVCGSENSAAAAG